MKNLGRNYVLLGLMWLVCGMAFGIYMGITQQMNFANSHAHANLVGFVVSVLFGLLHVNFPNLEKSRLAVPQFLIYEIGAVLLVAGKFQVDAGGADMLVRVGAVVVIIGAALMLYIFAQKAA
jgi:FtsH-binding integral membrane protein